MSLYTREGSLLIRAEAGFDGREVWNWMGTLSFEDQCALLRDNRMPFSIEWGRQTCTFTSEYRHWVWRFTEEMNGHTVLWYVLTGLKGTAVEVHADTKPKQRIEIMQRVLSIAKKHHLVQSSK